MKKILLAVVAIAFLLPFIVSADTYVDGYTKSNGTYVEGHYRSSPNSKRYDNYSSQGNSNPYTGSQGTQRNEYSNPPAYNKSYGTNYGNSYGR